MKFLFAAVLASALTVFVSSYEEDSFAGIPIAQLPDPGNEPAMARFIVNNANWTAFGYVSTKCGTGSSACPGNAVFATSDGKLGCGTGTPYFWSSRNHPTINDLLDKDPRGTVVMTLAQTPICRERGWDPQDPRCAHVTISGNFHKLDEQSAEYKVAKDALLTRHPQFAYYPPGHKWFYAKLNITSIGIISKFGGPIDIKIEDYYKVKC